MNYFDNFDTEDEISKLQKLDCLYTEDIISLDDQKAQSDLDYYSYELYMSENNKKKTEDKKAGGTNE